MDSKQQFLDVISKEYTELVQGQVYSDLVDAVLIGITNYYYDQYQRFRKLYPKSIKRYSKFQISDLSHPDTLETIIKILKEEAGEDYQKPAAIFLKMTMDELTNFEKNREEFRNMF